MIEEEKEGGGGVRPKGNLFKRVLNKGVDVTHSERKKVLLPGLIGKDLIPSKRKNLMDFFLLFRNEKP